jgi:small redox-active disulfide protein 2
MVIKILGSGCPKCKKLEENARQAVVSAGVDAIVEKVSDIKQIMEYGVMMTPALVIDETVRASGRLLTVDEIKKFIIGESV